MARGRVVLPQRNTPGEHVKGAERRKRTREQAARMMGRRGASRAVETRDPNEADAAEALLVAEERLAALGIEIDLDDDTVVELKDGTTKHYYVRVKGKRLNSLSIMRYSVSLKGVKPALIAVAKDQDADKIEWIFRPQFAALAEDASFKPKDFPLFDRAG